MQKELGKSIGVSEELVSIWERDQAEPGISNYPAVISFLGLVPFPYETETFGGKIRLYRYLKGLSQEGLARELGINESMVIHYEKGKHTPHVKMRNRVLSYMKKDTSILVKQYLL